jgi:hypothetical protein
VTEAARKCACGCGETVVGRRSRLYVSESHRMRALRARRAAERDVELEEHRIVQLSAPPAPNGEHERVRPAVDEWVKEQDDLPAPMVAAARALAAQVDMAPKSSPLWGRLTTVLTELMTPAMEARAWSVTQRQLVEQIAISGHDEAWRAAKYREAVDAGMPADAWRKVVPIGCVEDEHTWRQVMPGREVCRYCDTVRTEET